MSGRSPSWKNEGVKSLGGRGTSPGTLAAVANFRIPRGVIEKRLEELEELLRGWGEGEEAEGANEVESRRRRRKETKAFGGTGEKENGRRCVRVKRYKEKELREFMRRRRKEDVEGRREEEEQKEAERRLKERRLEELGMRVEGLRRAWRRRRKVEEQRVEGGGGVEEKEDGGELVEGLNEEGVRLMMEEFEGIVGEVCREFFTKVSRQEEAQLKTEDKAVETERERKLNESLEAKRKKETYGRTRNSEGHKFIHEECEESSHEGIEPVSFEERWQSPSLICEGDFLVVSTPDGLFRSLGGEPNELERSLWEDSCQAESKGTPEDFHSIISTFKLNLHSEKHLLRSLLNAAKSPAAPKSHGGLIYSAVEAAVEEALRQFHIHS